MVMGVVPGLVTHVLEGRNLGHSDLDRETQKKTLR